MLSPFIFEPHVDVGLSILCAPSVCTVQPELSHRRDRVHVRAGSCVDGHSQSPDLLTMTPVADA